MAFKLFNRAGALADTYSTGLEVLIRRDQWHRAVGVNVRLDHRVTPEREREFAAFVADPHGADEILNGIETYFDERIRTTKTPDFVVPSLNESNLVSGKFGHAVLHKDLELVRILDLTGLDRVYQWAKHALGMFRDLPGRLTDDTLADWLENHLANRHRSFIEDVLRALSERSKLFAFQPCWVTTWDAFEPILTEAPEKWLTSLGVYRPAAGRLLILLRYPVRDAGTVARPSQLDAGWYAHHFPSPPSVHLGLGGHPMDLSCSSGILFPEFIHEEIDYTIEYWDRTGQSVGKTSSPSPRNLGDQRSHHHTMLHVVYGDAVLSWMDVC